MKVYLRKVPCDPYECHGCYFDTVPYATQCGLATGCSAHPEKKFVKSTSKAYREHLKNKRGKA